MPRKFRYECRFRCRNCGKRVKKMGSCAPKVCVCGAGKKDFEIIEKIDLKNG